MYGNDEIEQIIKANNIAALIDGSVKEAKASDYLSVRSFNNDQGDDFIATVYDSDELWQDPTVVEIFIISNK